MNHQQIKSYNQILEQIGYSSHQIPHILLPGIVLIIEGMLLNLMSSISMPLRKHLSLSQAQDQVVNSIIHLGEFLGSSTVGYFTGQITRKKYLLMNLCVMNLAFVFSTLFVDFYSTIITRSVLGFNIGVLLSISMNIVVEYLPVRFRYFVLTALWAFYNIGQALDFVYLRVLMPDYQQFQVKPFMAACAVTILLLSFLLISILDDSPKDLILNNEEFKGVVYIKELASEKLNLELSRNQMVSIIKDIKATETNLKLQGSYLDLFNARYLRSTVLLTVANFLDLFLVYSIFLILPHYMTAIEIDSVGTIGSMIALAVASFLCSFLVAVMGELELLKRRWTIISCYALGALCLGVMLADSSRTGFWSVCGSTLVSMADSALNVFVVEIYHTKIRDKAYGFIMGTGRLGAFLSSFVVLWLFSLGIYLPWVLMIVLLLLVCLCVFLTNEETYQRLLDV